MVMVVVVHQMLHRSAGAARDSGRQQGRRLLFEAVVHSRLHCLVQSEHHLDDASRPNWRPAQHPLAKMNPVFRQLLAKRCRLN